MERFIYSQGFSNPMPPEIKPWLVIVSEDVMSARIDELVSAHQEGKSEEELLSQHDPVSCEVEPGSWKDFEVPEDTGDSAAGFALGIAELNIPLLPKRITVDLSYKGEIGFRECFLEDEDRITFPYVNPLFNQDNLVQREPFYRFVADYSFADLPADFGELEKTVRHTPQKFKKNLLFTSPGLQEIFFKEMIPWQFKKKSVKATVDKIYAFVRSAKGSKDLVRKASNEGWIQDLEKLVGNYIHTGAMPPDCKSRSTFIIGISYGLGLGARKLQGCMIDTYEKTEMPHAWAEICLPLDKGRLVWLPVDPSDPLWEVKGIYPEASLRYVATAHLPRFLDPSVKHALLRVDYQ